MDAYFVDVNPRKWMCRCECGTERPVFQANLTKGYSKGCNKHEHPHRHIYPKRAKQIPEWKKWSNMKNRCQNPNNRSYKYYGGRGIEVCPEWCAKDGFLRFMEDMGPLPTADHTIERKDANGPYAPWNCTWATWQEQKENTRRTVRILHNGIIHSASMWAKIYHLDYHVIIKRYRSGIKGDALFD